MIGRATYATRSPEAAREFFCETYLEAAWHGAVDRDGFELASDRIDVGPFQLDGMRMTSRVVSTFRPDDVYFVTHLHQGSFDVRGAGLDQRVVAGELVLGGRPGIETTTDAIDIDQDVLSIGATVVRQAAGCDPDDERGPVFTSIRPVSPARAGTWLATRAYFQSMLARDDAMDSPLLVSAAVRLLAALLLETFPNSAIAASAPREIRAPGGSETLRRAVSFIDSNAQLDIGIAEIATAARASRRSVEYAFRRHLGATPTTYLRQVRLDHAHRELTKATPEDGVTVTEVAYRWGFSSPSRFAEYYRAAFGCRPGETLRS